MRSGAESGSFSNPGDHSEVPAPATSRNESGPASPASLAAPAMPSRGDVFAVVLDAIHTAEAERESKAGAAADAALALFSPVVARLTEERDTWKVNTKTALKYSTRYEAERDALQQRLDSYLNWKPEDLADQINDAVRARNDLEEAQREAAKLRAELAERDLVFTAAARDVTAVRDENDKLRAELEAARSFGEEAAKQYNDLIASGPTLTCAFCGESYEPGTPPTQHERLTAHVKVCSKHPMREVEAKLRAAQPSATVGLDVFAVTREFLALPRGQQTAPNLEDILRKHLRASPREPGGATGAMREAARLRQVTAFSEGVLLLEIEQAKEAKDAAYTERDSLVCALSKLFPSWIARHPNSDTDWDDEWRWIVFVQLPTGQASWHVHDREIGWFAHCATSGDKWDGHTTPEKYERLARLRAAPERQGVVLPERCKEPPKWHHPAWDAGLSQGWNDALDAVERLNAAGAAPGTPLSEEDREWMDAPMGPPKKAPPPAAAPEKAGTISDEEIAKELEAAFKASMGPGPWTSAGYLDHHRQAWRAAVVRAKSLLAQTAWKPWKPVTAEEMAQAMNYAGWKVDRDSAWAKAIADALNAARKDGP